MLAAERLSFPSRAKSGFTLMEVLISTLLISMAVGSIVALSARSARALRYSRQTSASSQILQQRIEMLRGANWVEVTSSMALARLMETPAASEAELADATMVELLEVTVPKASPEGLVETEKSFAVRRTSSGVSIDRSGDFTGEQTLLYQTTVTWRDQTGPHRRSLRTIVCRNGLTRSGTVGTVLGRPGSYGGPTP